MKPPIWLALPLSAALSFPVQADEITPRPGEITLEGTISALNADVLTLKASKFTLAANRSRAISPPKSKTIALKSARLLGASGVVVAFSDLKVGELVSITGREIGAGKPFAARVLKATASSTKAGAPPLASSTKESALAPEVDEGYALAGVVPLLPHSKNVGGVNLRVVDAGWTSLSQIFADQNYFMGDQDLRFGLTYRAFVPRVLRSASTVRFNGLLAPDGTFLPPNWTHSGVSGNPRSSAQMLFGGVDPRWTSVRGEWEVMSGEAKPGASGQVLSDHQLEIPVPAKSAEAGETKPNGSFTTARGTKITLTAFKRENDYLKLEWDYQGVLGAEDVIVEMSQVQVTSSLKTASEIQGQNSQTLWIQHGFVVYVHQVPDEAQTLTLKFKVSETSRAWRDKNAFERVSMEIPIASLLQSAPLEPRMPPYAPTTTAGEGVAVTWEGLTPGSDSFGGNVWMRDLTADPKPDTFWLVRAAKGVFTDQIDTKERLIYGLERRNESFFHSDNTLKRPNDSSTWLHIDVARGEKRAEKIDLQLTLDRAQLQRKTHRFQNIPLPKSGETRTFDADDFSDELTAVRRVAWVADVKTLPETANLFSGWQGAALFITLDITRIYPEGDWDFNELRFFDDKGQVDIARQQQFQRNDPLGKLPASPTQFTIMIPAPYTGAPSFDLMFTVSERKWLDQKREVRLKDIGIPAAPQN